MVCVVHQVLVSNGEKYECGSKNPFAEGNETLASTAYRWASALKLCLYLMYLFTDIVSGALCQHMPLLCCASLYTKYIVCTHSRYVDSVYCV